jgi:hypothetical protein
MQGCIRVTRAQGLVAGVQADEGYLLHNGANSSMKVLRNGSSSSCFSLVLWGLRNGSSTQPRVSWIPEDGT